MTYETDYTPSVSLVIATSNRAESLLRTLHSLLTLDYPADLLEVLVIDDGSVDNTRKAVESLTKHFLPIPLQCHSLPKGNITHARNRGVEEATGDVVVFTDDDCTFDKHWLRTLVKPLQDEQVGAVGGGDCAPPDLAPFEGAVDYAFCSFLGVGGVRHGGAGHRAARYVPRGCNMAARRKVIIEAGCFDTRFYNGEEIDLDYRIEKAGYRLVFQDHCTVQHHRRATWKGLIRQVSGRGRTRHMLFRKHPECFELAYIAPAIALAGAILCLIAAAFSEWCAQAVGLGVVAYAILLLLGGLHALVTGHAPAAAIRVPPILALMHVSYGAGYWKGILNGSETLNSSTPRALQCLISNDGFGPNQGDRAILQVMRTDLQSFFPGVEIRGFLNAWVPGPLSIFKFWRDLRWADVFILGGGQVLHDQTCLLFLMAGLLKLMAARLASTPFVCYGIGVGPIHSRIGRSAVRHLLRHAALILVRDNASKQLLMEIGLPSHQIQETADHAFRLPLLSPEAVDSICHRLDIDLGHHPCVAICPRRWFHYAHRMLPTRWSRRRAQPTETAAFSELLNALAGIADSVIEKGGSILLIPMKRSNRNDPGQDDNVVCHEILARMRQPDNAKILDADLSPNDLTAILSQQDAVVSMRMHAVILSALHGTPAVGIGLSDKFSDCFARLNQSEHLIPVEHATQAALAVRLDTALNLETDAQHSLQETARLLGTRAEENVQTLRKWITTHTLVSTGEVEQ